MGISVYSYLILVMEPSEKKLSVALQELREYKEQVDGIIDYCESEWLSSQDSEKSTVYDTTKNYTTEALSSVAEHIHILGANLTHYLILQDQELDGIEVAVTRCKALCHTQQFDASKLQFRTRKKRQPVSKIKNTSLQNVERKKFQHKPLDFNAFHNVVLGNGLETVALAADRRPNVPELNETSMHSRPNVSIVPSRKKDTKPNNDDTMISSSSSNNNTTTISRQNDSNMNSSTSNATSGRTPPSRRRMSSNMTGNTTSQGIPKTNLNIVTPRPSLSARGGVRPRGRGGVRPRGRSGVRPRGGVRPPRPMPRSTRKTTAPVRKKVNGNGGRGGLMAAIQGGAKLKSAKSKRKDTAPAIKKPMSMMEEMAAKRKKKAAKKKKIRQRTRQ